MLKHSILMFLKPTGLLLYEGILRMNINNIYCQIKTKQKRDSIIIYDDVF
jgi:hypothetical protein